MSLSAFVSLFDNSVHVCFFLSATIAWWASLITTIFGVVFYVYRLKSYGCQGMKSRNEVDRQKYLRFDCTPLARRKFTLMNRRLRWKPILTINTFSVLYKSLSCYSIQRLHLCGWPLSRAKPVSSWASAWWLPPQRSSVRWSSCCWLRSPRHSECLMINDANFGAPTQ